MKITVYQKPTCTTCRQVYKVLRESGVDLEAVDYYVRPLTRGRLRRLLEKMGITASALLRTKEPIYKKLNLGARKVGEEELIGLMIKYPDLMQRPIVERGEKAIVARPAERIRDFLIE